MSETATQVGVKETGMIFLPHNATAISEGRKTQTRRVIKPQPAESWMNGTGVFGKPADWSQYYKTVRGQIRKNLWLRHPTENKEITCPYGKPGDRVYVKESVWAYSGSNAFHYSSDEPAPKASAHLGFQWHCHQMPKAAARIWLEITNIRVERLQDISGADAKAEGVDPFMGKDATAYRAAFQLGWNDINGKRGYTWESNPWVWVIELKKI